MMRGRNTSSRLRHRLTLQEEAQAPDGAGGYIRSWNNVTDVWAEIIPATGAKFSGSASEPTVAMQAQSEVTHKILLRYRDGVTAGMRLLFENRAFNIRQVINTSENDETLELLAQEGVAT